MTYEQKMIELKQLIEQTGFSFVWIEGLRIRLNTDSTNDVLIGWTDFTLAIYPNYKIYMNNIKVKKKKIDDEYALVMDYPHKKIEKNGEITKKYYFKPINKDTYFLIESVIIHRVKEEIIGQRKRLLDSGSGSVGAVSAAIHSSGDL